MPSRTLHAEPIIAELEVEAPPVRVYRALVDPEQLAEWWHEPGTPVRWEMDLRPGGRWRAAAAAGQGGRPDRSGQILEVEPPRLLAYTWTERSDAHPQPVSSVVRYDVSPTARGALVRITQSGLVAPAARDEHRRRWPGVLAALARFTAEHVTAT